MGGTVKIFNSSATGATVTVNGSTRFVAKGTTPKDGWVPSSPATNPTRSDDGNPGDGIFSLGSVNHITVTEASGAGEVSNFDVTIPPEIQTFEDLQFYVFYSPNPKLASWVMCSNGMPIGSGNVKGQTTGV